jgi:HEAT repeat protein
LGINIETIVALSKDEHAEIRAATVDALFQVVDEDVLHKRELGEEEDALDAMIERLEKDENAIVRERVADVKKDYGL